MSLYFTQNKTNSIIVELGEDICLLVRSSDNSFDLYRRKEKSWDWIDSVGLESAKERIGGADVVFVEISSDDIKVGDENESQ